MHRIGIFRLVGMFRLAMCVMAASMAGPAAAEVASVPTDADPHELTLDYEAYFGGFHIGSARTTILRDGSAYEVVAKARARGLLDWYSGWQGMAVSRGLVGDGLRVFPELHNNEGLWQGGARSNSLTYLSDGSVDVTQDDPPDPSKLTPIPEGSIAGTVDPISAIMALARTMEVAGDCTGTIPVYDGRRRYDLSVTQGRVKSFDANEYTIFDGDAVACEVMLERIGGFRKEQTKYQQTARDRIVWVAKPLPDAPPIPVRIDVRTDFGDLIVHLAAARYAGREIAVEPGRDNLADD